MANGITEHLKASTVAVDEHNNDADPNLATNEALFVPKRPLTLAEARASLLALITAYITAGGHITPDQWGAYHEYIALVIKYDKRAASKKIEGEDHHVVPEHHNKDKKWSLKGFKVRVTKKEHIVPLAMHADVLIHEATNAFFGSEKSERYSNYYQLERDTLKHGHSTPEMAGRFAAQIKAKTLLLTHFSPRYRGDDEYIHMKRMWTIEDMARNAANGTLEGVNEVVAAWDQLCLPVALQEAAAGAAGVSGSQMN